MKVRLIAVDSKIPNYALMKISTYHKRKGDNVGWYDHLFDYEDTDILYISKVFTFTKDVEYLPINAKIIKGGTGYDYNTKLPQEIEDICELDYNLYPNCDYSIIFTTNKPLSEWGEVFGDSVIANAILDRILHHSYVVNISGKSYRLKNMIVDNDSNSIQKYNLLRF